MTPASSAAQESYNLVTYPGDPFVQTHPDRLATLATLFGMMPAPIERCRVLEIGCTDGGNLIPMAYALPDAHFVGLDISAREIAAGCERIETLGLKNIRLLALDILDVPRDFGTFDYIIAHGVFSWVPPEVQEKILAICRAHLAPQGVAYISYNTYPGGYFRDLVRGMMRYHVREISDPEEKRRHGVALLQFITDSQPQDELYGQVIRAELERLREKNIASIFHDDLAELRTSFYFDEFVARAAQHDLQFLAEAAFHEMQDQSFAPPVVNALRSLAHDRIAHEQYRDFLQGRRFRKTLLCHREVALSEPRAETVRRFFISSRARPVSATPVLDDSTPEEFVTPGGAQLKTSNSLAKAIIVHLAEIWPQSMTFEKLLAAGRARLGTTNEVFTSDQADSEFAEALLAMYSAGLIEFHMHVPRFTLEVSERPVVSPVARWSLARGASEFTNLLHRSVKAGDPIATQLMLLLDGTRDRPALVCDLTAFCQSRGILLKDADGATISDATRMKQILEAGLEDNLHKLGRMAVLVA